MLLNKFLIIKRKRRDLEEKDTLIIMIGKQGLFGTEWSTTVIWKVDVNFSYGPSKMFTKQKH